AETRRRRSLALPVYSLALYERGIQRGSAVSIFYQPWRPWVGGGRAAGTARRVRRVQLADRTARPAGREHFFAGEAQPRAAARRAISNAVEILSRAHSVARLTWPVGPAEQRTLRGHWLRSRAYFSPAPLE